MSDIILSKESFKNSIETILLQEGFTKKEDKYVKEIRNEIPGAVMMFNGRPMQEPPRVEIIEMVIEEFGDGYIESDDSKVDFTEYHIKVIRNGLESGICPAINWNDANEIKKYLNI